MMILRWLKICSIESTGRAWEHDSLYGHSNNVCSAVFHDKLVSGGKMKKF